MAERLARAGASVRGFDRTRAKVQSLAVDRNQLTIQFDKAGEKRVVDSFCEAGVSYPSGRQSFGIQSFWPFERLAFKLTQKIQS